ncbi:hypothetical protein V6N13_084059 [Hibiscus sabdariffa]|uniref:Dynein light chain n=1 Tax=Hibiscus sabdariffa TaxID=183260 RepID=A0ABR2T0M7_9ROSI
MLEGKALVEDTDMPMKMQFHAMSIASQALDLHDVFDYKLIAGFIKKEFDMKYGEGWQCVVGSKFGCYFSHSKGTFIYFTMGSLNFLLFKMASSSDSYSH